MSGKDNNNISVLKAKVEELKKKLKEEQDVKNELIKRAQDVLQSKKQLREVYVGQLDEKFELEAKLKEMKNSVDKKFGDSAPETLNKLRKDNENLRKEKEELEKLIEAEQKKDHKNDNADSPLVIAQKEEIERLKMRIEVETQVRAQLEAIHLQDQHPSTQKMSEFDNCYFISAEDARLLANKIKQLQLGILDLEVKIEQKKNHKFEEDKEPSLLSLPSQEDIEEPKKEVEEEKDRREQYNNLVESLFTLQFNVKNLIMSAEPSESIAESMRHFLDNMQLDQYRALELKVATDKKLAKKNNKKKSTKGGKKKGLKKIPKGKEEE